MITPVLSQIAADFGVSAGTAGLVVAAYGAPGMAITVVAGPYSDRFGRRRFLLVGSAVMAFFTLVAAFAPSFSVLMVARAIAGVGASVIQPNVLATVADNFPNRERGRALATVVSVNVMASLIGVPVAGIIGEATSWRVSLAIVGAIAVAATALFAVRPPPTQVRVSDARIRELYRSIATNRSAIAALGSSLFGNLYWVGWVTFIVVFFQRSFGLSQSIAATLALTVGLGTLVGSQIGGRVSDRIGRRPVIAGALLGSAALLLLQTNLPLGLPLTVLVNFLAAAVLGMRLATHQALLSEQVPEARGTLLGLSAWTHYVATVVGASLGGVLIDEFGFWALGLFSATMAATAAAIVIAFVREGPVEVELESG